MTIEKKPQFQPDLSPDKDSRSGGLSSGEKKIVPLTSVPSIVRALRTYLEDDGHDMYLKGGITLAPERLEALAIKLEQPGIPDKIRKLKHDFSQEPPDNIIPRLVAGRLKTTVPALKKGKSPLGAAKDLLNRLARISQEGETETVIEREEKNILTHDQLTATMDLVEHGLFDIDGSVAQQLQNPLTLPSTGLIVTLKREESQIEERGFALPHALLKTLEGLKHTESAEVLKDWTLQTIVSRRDECISFLETLVQFSGLLDNEAYLQIYAAGEGHVQLLPFQSLYDGIVGGLTYLKGLRQKMPVGSADPQLEEAIRDLENVEHLMVYRFRQVLSGEMRSQLAANPNQILRPSTEDLALTTHGWVYEERKRQDLSDEQAAPYILKHIQQSGSNDVLDYCNQMTNYLEEPELAEAVLEEAVKQGLVEGDKKLVAQIQASTLQTLKDKPWIDVEDINFAKVIKPNIDLLRVAILTGTWAPGHNGHMDLIKRVGAYYEYLDKLEKVEQENLEEGLEEVEKLSTQTLILIVPITQVHAINNSQNKEGVQYDKRYQEVGSEYERTATLMLLLANEDRGKIYLTTRLQPDPNRAISIERSIQETIAQLDNKISNDLWDDKRLVSFSAEYTLWGGSDEVKWDGDRLDKQQPRKLRMKKNPCGVVGRHGHLINLVKNSDELKQRTTGVSAVLTPDTANISSSKLRKRIRKGDPSGIPVRMRHFVMDHWSQKAYEDRGAGRGIEDKVPSVTEIYHRLVKEYGELIAAQ